MWKLEIAEGKEDPWLVRVNNYIGRQHWEFDPQAGTLEEQADIERAREGFKRNRFSMRQSYGILMRMQLRKENPSLDVPRAIQLQAKEKITKEAVENNTEEGFGLLLYNTGP